MTFEGDIILELLIENSSLGEGLNVAGQNLPSFNSRKVQTKLRLRDGESNLLAGLLQEEERRSLRGFPGILRLPIIKQLLLVQRQHDRPDRHRDAADAAHRAHARADAAATSTRSSSARSRTSALAGPPPVIVPGQRDAGRRRRGRAGRAAPSPAGAGRPRPRRRRHRRRRPRRPRPPRRRRPIRPRRRRRRPACAGASGGGQIVDLAAVGRVPRRRRSLHAADLGHRRVAAVVDVADGHLQPGRGARAHGAGGQLHALGRRAGGLHATAQTPAPDASTSPSCARRHAPAWPAPGSWPRSLFDAVAPGPANLTVTGTRLGAGRRAALAAVRARHGGDGAVGRDAWSVLAVPPAARRRPRAPAATASSSCWSSSSILFVLASAAMPLAQVASQRQREAELRRDAARDADGDRQVQGRGGHRADSVDRSDAGQRGLSGRRCETLVDGVTAANDASGRKLKFLRRVPIDPMTGNAGVGHARLPGQAGRDVLGRAERVRRVHEERGPRRSTARSTGTGR